MRVEKARSSLRTIEAELQKTLARREQVLKDSRDAILSSSRAIVAVHTGRISEARKELATAERVLARMRSSAGEGPLAHYLVSPETEFVEASAVISMVEERAVPGLASVRVSPDAYLLGLLDSVGELKRLLLVAVTAGDLARAEEYFGAMEELYNTLSPFAVFDNVVKGVRRKIDVARMLTEDCRGIIAEETRRRALIDSIESARKRRG